MKIALSGSGSTGKSTLSKIISEKYNIPMIPEFAREVAEEMKLENIRKLTPDLSFTFQKNILNRKISEEKKYETFIADRSTADVAAYYFRWCCRDMDEDRNKQYIENCFKNLKTYDKIILLPWNSIPVEADGFRSAKLYYQYEMHCLVLGILNDQKIDYEIMVEKSLEDRIKYLDKYFK